MNKTIIVTSFIMFIVFSMCTQEDDNIRFTKENSTRRSQGYNINWEKEIDSAGWESRDSQSAVVYENKLWIMGGWVNSYKPALRDVWSSRDGKNWSLENKSAPWIYSDLSMSIVFNGKMWLMGGWCNGRLPGYSASNQVWASSDGVNWRQVTENAAWTARLGAALIEFKGKMWLLGGVENYFFGNMESLKNDIWYSSDGKKWILATANAGWSPRAFHKACVLNRNIYVFGGGNYLPEYQAKNDVWCSEDGIHWKQVIPNAPWHERLWFSSVVYRNRIWIMGGWSKVPYSNWSDVWYTKDGKKWELFTSNICWSGRHESSAFVFRDKLWIAGGNTYPVVNDVWSLKIPEDWFDDE